MEFALSLMTVLFVLFCCWELLLAIYTASVMADAAKEGVRYAIVHGSHSASCPAPCTTDPANVTAKVTEYAQASLHDISAIVITVEYPDGGNDTSDRVAVTVTYTYVPYIQLPFFHPTFTTHAQGRIVY